MSMSALQEQVVGSDKGLAPAAEPLCWCKQRHSWAFAGIIVINLPLAWCFVRSLISIDQWVVQRWAICIVLGMVGLVLGQLYLAAIWLAFGGLSAPLRMALVALVIVSGALLGVTAATDVSEMVLMKLFAVGISLLIVLLAQIVLAPLRWMTGWRIDFDPAYHPKDNTGRMQLHIWHYMALTLIIALPLGIYQGLTAISNDAGHIFAVTTLAASMTLLVAAPLTWVLLVRQRVLRAIAILLAGLGLAAVTGVAMTVIIDGMPILSWNSVAMLCMLAGVMISVAANILLLRWQGLQLFCVKRTASG